MVLSLWVNILQKLDNCLGEALSSINCCGDFLEKKNCRLSDSQSSIISRGIVLSILNFYNRLLIYCEEKRYFMGFEVFYFKWWIYHLLKWMTNYYLECWLSSEFIGFWSFIYCNWCTLQIMHTDKLYYLLLIFWGRIPRQYGGIYELYVNCEELLIEFFWT